MTNQFPTAVDKTFYVLVAGELLFQQSKDDDTLYSCRKNTLIRSTHEHITAHQLGRAQQAMQLALFEQLKNPNLQIKDVVIMSLCPLGWMTEDEFKATPDGVKLQQKPEA